MAATLAALAGLGTPPSASPPPASPSARPVGAPPAPPVARPARPLRALLTKLITKALAANEDRILWLSAADLDLLGIDEATLDKLLDRLDLYVAENVDGNGGVLIAKSLDLLQGHLQPERPQPIPVYAVMRGASKPN
jgi:hypothetical protein